MKTGPDIAPLSVEDWTMSLLCLILPRGSPRIFEFLPTSSNTLMTAAHRVFKTLYGQYPFVCTKTRNFLSNVLCRWCVNCKEYSTVNTELKGRLLKVTVHSTSTYIVYFVNSTSTRSTFVLEYVHCLECTHAQLTI